MISMKKRHSSEEVFFNLMAEVGLVKTSATTIPLPGDVEIGEEEVLLYAFELARTFPMTAI